MDESGSPSKIVPLKRPRRRLEDTYRRFSRWINGELAWIDEAEFDPLDFFSRIDTKTFEEFFARWKQEFGDMAASVARWIHVLPSLSPGQLTVVVQYVRDRVSVGDAESDRHLVSLIRLIPNLDESRFAQVFGLISAEVKHKNRRTRREFGVELLKKYSWDWVTPSFPRVFSFVTETFMKQDPSRFGRAAAEQGVPLGVPRLSAILRRHSDSLPPQPLDAYRKFWSRAHRAFISRREEIKRARKLLGSFNRALGMQRAALHGILHEAELLKEKGFFAASVVWAWVAFEVFFTKVVARAWLEGLGLVKGEVMEVINGFLQRNGKHRSLAKMLANYYRIKLSEDEWRDFAKLRDLRNLILHAGVRQKIPEQHAKYGRYINRQLAEFAINAVGKLFEDVHKQVKLSQQAVLPPSKIHHRVEVPRITL